MNRAEDCNSQTGRSQSTNLNQSIYLSQRLISFDIKREEDVDDAEDDDIIIKDGTSRGRKN